MKTRTTLLLACASLAGLLGAVAVLIVPAAANKDP